jgi:protein-S-isoprenylcysteine O-methyltransferase Ste14
MKAVVSVAYGLVAYAVFFVTFLYFVGFVGNLDVPKSIDSGSPVPLLEALIVNTLLVAIFGLQHSVMARPGFKRWWTRIVPPPIERSTFVLFASLALLLLYWQWRPITAVIWSVEKPLGALALHALGWIGWTVVLISTFLINHFELFGLRQVFAPMSNRPLPAQTFKTPLFYRYVRHPIYFGFLLALWCTPHMSAGRLLFAAAMTAYVLIGVHYEERDLVSQLGEQYRRYREQVGMLVPLPRRKR